jgi:hypothetical protein
VEIFVSAYLPVYTRHFPFISQAAPLASSASSSFRLLHRFHPPSFPAGATIISLAACSCSSRATLHPVDCIPFGLPRTNASFDSRDSKKTSLVPERPSSIIRRECFSRSFCPAVRANVSIILDSLTALSNCQPYNLFANSFRGEYGPGNSLLCN